MTGHENGEVPQAAPPAETQEDVIAPDTAVTEADRDSTEHAKLLAILHAPEPPVTFPQLRNIVAFTIAYGCIEFFMGLQDAYFLNIIDTVAAEHTHRISEAEREFLIGSGRIGFIISLLLVSFFGNRLHKSLIILCGSLIICASSVLFIVPHLLYLRSQADAGNTTQRRPEGVSLHVWGSLCGGAPARLNLSSSAGHCPSAALDDYRTQTYGIFCTANFVSGIGSGFISTVGIVYIDDNSPGNRSSLLIGFVIFLNAVGEFIGVCFAYATTASYASWWVFFPVVTVGAFVCAPMFLCFPRWFKIPEWLVVEIIREREKHKRRKLNEKQALMQRRKKRQKDKQKSEESQPPDQHENGARHNAGFESSADVDIHNTANGDILAANRDSDSETNSAQPNGAFNTEDLTNTNCIIADENVYVQRKTEAKDTHVFNDAVDDSSDHKEKQYEHKKHDVKRDVQRSGAAFSTKSAPAARAASDGRRTKQEIKALWIEKYRKRKGGRLQDLCVLMWRMLRQPVFLLVTLGAVLAAYLPGGYLRALAQYVSTQYRKPSPSITLTEALAVRLPLAVGCLMGGAINYRWLATPLRKVQMILLVLLSSSVLLAVLLALGCANIDHVGLDLRTSPLELARPCNSRCACSDVSYHPVCSARGHEIHSPCHAGCRDIKSTPHVNFTACSCGGGWARDGPCEDRCAMFWGFAALLALLSAVHAAAYVPVITILMRTVKEKFRSLALGLAVWIVNLLAFFPGPAVYKAVQDSQCLLWRKDCNDQDVCWSYNVTSYRYLQHGLTLAFQVVAACIFGIACLKFRHMKPKSDDEVIEDLPPEQRIEEQQTTTNHADTKL